MKLRLVEFNVENLFAYIDHYKNQDIRKLTETEWQALSTSVIPNKPIHKLNALATAIQEMNPDILMLCEIGGLESLENLNRFFLNSEYTPQFIEGNSDRGIDIAYLVKRSLNFKYDLRSHRHRPIHFLYPHEDLSNAAGYKKADGSEYKSHKFSRDVLELRIFRDGQTAPVLVSLLVHLKSKWDRDGVDPSGRDRRQAELRTLVEIYQELQHEFSGRVPVVVGGDFNGQAGRTQTDQEFSEIYRATDLEDCLQVAAVASSERTTYVHILNHTNKTVPTQLDYIFLPKGLQAKLDRKETYVYRFKDEWKSPYPIPINMPMKRELPSDHYPVVATIDVD